MDPSEMTSPDAVTAQYASTERLATRRSVWRPGPEGVSPIDVLRQTVVDLHPADVLEVGCGTGDLAASLIDAVPNVRYTATDLSPAMVNAAAARGVPALVAPADALPFDDASFDVAIAAWMLYHVPDVHAALRELRRVLCPGAVLVVATNGEAHLADLLREAGGELLVTQFTAEVATSVLRRHFTDVTQRDIETRAYFEDHAAAAAYLATFDVQLSRSLPFFSGPRSYAGHSTVLTAR